MYSDITDTCIVSFAVLIKSTFELAIPLGGASLNHQTSNLDANFALGFSIVYCKEVQYNKGK